MNIHSLLQPISTASPCGENLEYDPEFMALGQSLFGKEEQQFGDVIIPAEPPNWILAEKQAIHLLNRTKDLRIIMALAQAWLETQGLCGYANGLDLIQQTLECYWEDVWPTLEFEGEYDPEFRLNILAAIEDDSPLSLQMQHAILLRSTTKELSFLEVFSLLDGTVSQISGYTGGRSRLQEELKQQTNSPEILAVIKIRDHLIAIFNLICHKLSENCSLELAQLLKQLNRVIEFCPISHSSQETREDTQETSFQDRPESADTTQKMLSPTTTCPTNSRSAHWHEIEASNREEARVLLEKAKNYFLTYEPSHPAPMMIDRIQRLIDRDFIDIVCDLAPDGLNQLEIIFGRPDNLGSD